MHLKWQFCITIRLPKIMVELENIMNTSKITRFSAFFYFLFFDKLQKFNVSTDNQLRTFILLRERKVKLRENK